MPVWNRPSNYFFLNQSKLSRFSVHCSIQACDWLMAYGIVVLFFYCSPSSSKFDVYFGDVYSVHHAFENDWWEFQYPPCFSNLLAAATVLRVWNPAMGPPGNLPTVFIQVNISWTFASQLVLTCLSNSSRVNTTQHVYYTHKLGKKNPL